MIREHETERQKLNRLGKCLNIYHTKKELCKIQSTLQNTTKKIQLSQNISKEINIQTKQNNENKCFQKKDRYLYSENLQFIQNASNEIIQVSVSNTQTEQNNENYSQNKNIYLENLLHLTQSASNEIIEVLVNKIQTKENQNGCTYYEQDLQKNRAKKRHRYEQDLEHNRT